MTDEAEPPALPRSIVRSVVTGCVVGAVLCVCNIYASLKVGWSTNMSITSALLGYAVWRLRPRSMVERSPFTIFESNLSQTAASSTAAISSAGLAAAVPALTIMTGFAMPWYQLAVWLLAVVLVGNVIAIPIRHRMIVVEKLPFPAGLATAETLRQIYAKGREAMSRVGALVAGAVVSAVVKLCETYKVIAAVALPGSIAGFKLRNLTFAVDPSLLLVGVGGIMSVRACFSVMAGSVLAYGVIGPRLLAAGIVKPGPADKPWFKPLVEWLLWPGVTLMVVASLTTLALSWPVLVRGLRGLVGGDREPDEPGAIPRAWFSYGALFATAFAVVIQVWFFSIPWWAALIGVLLSALLGVVGARVAGETGLTPVGAMGKITQLTMGAALPGNVTANLMTANITGGAASQCADMMNDLKTGQEIGMTPRPQWISQVAGAAVGALVGPIVYVILIPDPKSMLITPEWPAPAVITWKTVAEVFSVGVQALPTGTPLAVAVAAVLGVVLAVLETKAPEGVKRWLPSPSALGLAFTVAANQCMSIFIGGLLGIAVKRYFPQWHARFWIVLCAGVIAGEGLTGAGLSVYQIFN
jgi:putative OPT family oligopeptide transporter